MDIGREPGHCGDNLDSESYVSLSILRLWTRGTTTQGANRYPDLSLAQGRIESYDDGNFLPTL